MSIHVCKCSHNGRDEYHLRYPGMTEKEALELADKINTITGKKIHVVTISRWKGVDVMPKINGKELDAIVKALGVTRNDLLGE